MEWKVKFMHHTLRPPHPFGRMEVVVEATSRDNAKAAAREKYGCLISPRYKITASKVR